MNPLQDKIIGLSISESNDLAELGFAKAHLEDANIEIARYLLFQGCNLAYGGDLRSAGFTRQLFTLVDNYAPPEKEKNICLHSYLGYPIGTDLTDEQRLKWIDVVRFNVLDLPDDLPPMDAGRMKEDKTPESRYYWFRSMSNMRKRMNENIHARVVLGGQSKVFKSKYPGIVEEVYLAMQAGMPVYLCGAFGGATRSVVEAIIGQPSPRLQMDYFTDPVYKEAVTLYNKSCPGHPVDYKALAEYFAGKGMEGLNNGLTEEENSLLFSTIHIPQMASLILKGLNKSFSGR